MILVCPGPPHTVHLVLAQLPAEAGRVHYGQATIQVMAQVVGTNLCVIAVAL